MKKKGLFIALFALAALLAGSALEARRGGHRGGRRGGRHGRHHGGRRHGGWGRRGYGWGSGLGFGISFGSPGYYGRGPVVDYLDDPYEWYWNRYPRASWDAYRGWLESNSYRFRRPWRSYYGPRYHRRWRARPRVGFGVGFGF